MGFPPRKRGSCVPAIAETDKIFKNFVIFSVGASTLNPYKTNTYCETHRFLRGFF
jgi:hypothetical protein